MIICLFIKSGLDNNIFPLSVCGEGVLLAPSPAMALYNNGFTIFIPAVPHDTSFILKPFKTRNRMQWRIIVPLISCVVYYF